MWFAISLRVSVGCARHERGSPYYALKWGRGERLGMFNEREGDWNRTCEGRGPKRRCIPIGHRKARGRWFFACGRHNGTVLFWTQNCGSCSIWVFLLASGWLRCEVCHSSFPRTRNLPEAINHDLFFVRRIVHLKPSCSTPNSCPEFIGCGSCVCRSSAISLCSSQDIRNVIDPTLPLHLSVEQFLKNLCLSSFR